MLTLRVLRGSGTAVIGRWLLVAAATAGSGLLLLSSLAWALAHPDGGTVDALVRLGWCAVPVTVTVQLASAVARAQPAGWPRTGLAAVGLGRTGVVMLGALSATVVCSLGSALALAVFLQLRGDVTGVPWNGVGPGLLAAGQPLPLAGAATLLAVVPVASAAACAWRLRGERQASSEVPGSLPWGVSLIAVGLAVQVAAPDGHAVPLPSGLGPISPGALGGWIVTAAGLVLAGPGAVHLCGRLLGSFRPGAVRLLAGRALQYEARVIGHPLGLLAAIGSVALAAYDSAHSLGPVSAFAATLVAVCVLTTAALTLREADRSRTAPRVALRAVAASPATLRAAFAIRATALLALILPAAALIAAVSAHP